MARLLQVAQLGHPILRKKAQLITKIKSESIQELIVDLTETVIDIDGVGMAAPQAYQSLRLFIIASHPNSRYPNAPFMKPTAVINPKILWHNDVTYKDWEGCLSIPGVRALIPRFTKIKVEYSDVKGKKVTKNFADFIAKIFQHENDHLDGIMFLDRVVDTKDIISEKEYLKLMAKKKSKKV
jgi:peptide deformylase